MYKKNKISKTVIALYILLLPILRYYKLPGDYLYLVVVNVMAFAIIFSNRRIYINKKIIIGIAFFVLWAVIVSEFAYNFSEYSHLVNSTSSHNLITLCDYIFLIMVCLHGGMDYKMFLTLYKWISYVLLVYLLLQIVGFSLPGFTMKGKIPYLEILDIYKRRGTNFGVYPGVLFTRYSSLFIEPSHFAQYITPMLCLSLYGYEDIIKKNIPLAIAISCLTLLSISGTGVAILAIVWIYYFIRESQKLSTSKVITMTIGMIAASIAVYFALQNAGIVTMLQGMSSFEDGKVSARVTRGFEIFGHLPLLNKIVGIGYQCVNPFCKYNNITVGIYSGASAEYINDLASMLISFGIIGCIPFVLLICHAFKNSGKLEMLIYISSLAIFISEATLGSVWLLLTNMCLAGYRLRKTKNHYKTLMENSRGKTNGI